MKSPTSIYISWTTLSKQHLQQHCLMQFLDKVRAKNKAKSMLTEAVLWKTWLQGEAVGAGDLEPGWLCSSESPMQVKHCVSGRPCSTPRTGKSSGRKRVGQIISQTQPHSLPTRLVTFKFWYCFLWRQFSVGRPCKLCTSNCFLQQLYLICHSWGVVGGRTHVAFLQPLLDEKCVNEEEGLKMPPTLQIASFCRYTDRTEQHWQFRKFEKHHNQLMDFFSLLTHP